MIAQQVLEVLGIAYGLADANGRLTEFTPSLANYAQSILTKGEPINTLFPAIQAQPQLIQQIISGQLAKHQIEYIQQAKQYLTLTLTNYEGGLLLIVQDTTHQAEYVQSLTQERNELRLSQRQKSDNH